MLQYLTGNCLITRHYERAQVVDNWQEPDLPRGKTNKSGLKTFYELYIQKALSKSMVGNYTYSDMPNCEGTAKLWSGSCCYI